MAAQPIVSDAAPAPIGPYSQAILAGDELFSSGQIAIDPRTGELHGDDAAAQTRRVLENVGAILRAAGMQFANVVKTTIFLVDMADFAAVNAVYAECFGDVKPARSTVAVAALPKNARVEIEVLAKR